MNTDDLGEEKKQIEQWHDRPTFWERKEEKKQWNTRELRSLMLDCSVACCRTFLLNNTTSGQVEDFNFFSCCCCWWWLNRSMNFVHGIIYTRAVALMRFFFHHQQPLNQCRVRWLFTPGMSKKLTPNNVSLKVKTVPLLPFLSAIFLFGAPGVNTSGC